MISDAAKFFRLRLVQRVFNFLHSVEARPEILWFVQRTKAQVLPDLGLRCCQLKWECATARMRPTAYGGPLRMVAVFTPACGANCPRWESGRQGRKPWMTIVPVL